MSLPTNHGLVPPPRPPSFQIQNEQAKLTATWLNSIASGIVVTGSVAPAIAAILGVTNVAGWIVSLSSLVWLSLGVALHFTARRILERLRP